MYSSYCPYDISEYPVEPLLSDAFYEWELNKGIFHYMSQLREMPWDTSEYVNPLSLDISYFGNHSGYKFCSPLVKLLLKDDKYLSETARTTIASVIITKYLLPWSKLWDTMNFDYSPIHNYDMNEDRSLTATEDGTSTIDSTLAKTGSIGNTGTDTETTTHGRTTNEMGYLFGINTDTLDPKPSDKNTMEEGGITGLNKTSTSTDTFNTTDTTRGRDTKDNKSTEKEETHRYGNIGVTTTQKLIEEERQLWLWNYFEQVFTDIDKELALKFHSIKRI